MLSFSFNWDLGNVCPDAIYLCELGSADLFKSKDHLHACFHCIFTLEQFGRLWPLACADDKVHFNNFTAFTSFPPLVPPWCGRVQTSPVGRNAP